MLAPATTADTNATLGAVRFLGANCDSRCQMWPQRALSAPRMRETTENGFRPPNRRIVASQLDAASWTSRSVETHEIRQRSLASAVSCAVQSVNPPSPTSSGSGPSPTAARRAPRL